VSRARDARYSVLNMAKELYNKSKMKMSNSNDDVHDDDDIVLHIYATCMLISCQLEASTIKEQPEAGEEDDEEECQNIDDKLIKEVLELLNEAVTSSTSTSSFLNNCLFEIKDFVKFIQGWCGMLSIHGMNVDAKHGLQYLSSLLDTKDHESLYKMVRNSETEHRLMIQLSSSSTYSDNIFNLKKMKEEVDENDEGQPIEEGPRIAALKLLEKYFVNRKSEARMLEIDINQLKEKYLREKKPTAANSNEASQRDLSYLHYTLAYCYDYMGNPTRTLNHAVLSTTIRKSWGGLSKEDLRDRSSLHLGLVDEENDQTVSLRPILRMDQWCLILDFYSTVWQMSHLFLRRGQPHMCAYWFEQGKEFALSLGSRFMFSMYNEKIQNLMFQRGRSMTNNIGGGGRKLEDIFAEMNVTEDEEEKKKEEKKKEEKKKEKVDVFTGSSSLLDVRKQRDSLRQTFMSSSVSSTSKVFASLHSIGWT
jgi:hypothetical protein